MDLAKLMHIFPINLSGIAGGVVERFNEESATLAGVPLFVDGHFAAHFGHGKRRTATDVDAAEVDVLGDGFAAVGIASGLQRCGGRVNKFGPNFHACVWTHLENGRVGQLLAEDDVLAEAGFFVGVADVGFYGIEGVGVEDLVFADDGADGTYDSGDLDFALVFPVVVADAENVAVEMFAGGGAGDALVASDVGKEMEGVGGLFAEAGAVRGDDDLWIGVGPGVTVAIAEAGGEFGIGVFFLENDTGGVGCGDSALPDAVVNASLSDFR